MRLSLQLQLFLLITGSCWCGGSGNGGSVYLWILLYLWLLLLVSLAAAVVVLAVASSWYPSVVVVAVAVVQKKNPLKSYYAAENENLIYYLNYNHSLSPCPLRSLSSRSLLVTHSKLKLLQIINDNFLLSKDFLHKSNYKIIITMSFTKILQ